MKKYLLVFLLLLSAKMFSQTTTFSSTGWLTFENGVQTDTQKGSSTICLDGSKNPIKIRFTDPDGKLFEFEVMYSKNDLDKNQETFVTYFIKANTSNLTQVCVHSNRIMFYYNNAETSYIEFIGLSSIMSGY